MNPKCYCIKNGVSTAEFIRKAQQIAPKYNKVAHCMASNTAYGLTLSPAVVRHISHKPENRTRPCKFTFRLLNSDNDEFNAARLKLGHSQQQACEAAIKLYIAKAAETVGAVSDGKEKYTS